MRRDYSEFEPLLTYLLNKDIKNTDELIKKTIAGDSSSYHRIFYLLARTKNENFHAKISEFLLQRWLSIPNTDIVGARYSRKNYFQRLSDLIDANALILEDDKIKKYWLDTVEKINQLSDNSTRHHNLKEFSRFFKLLIQRKSPDLLDFVSQTFNPAIEGDFYLRVAIMSKRIDSVKVLTKHINPKINKSNALNIACKMGLTDMIEYLIPLSTPKKENSRCIISALKSLPGNKKTKEEVLNIINILLPHANINEAVVSYFDCNHKLIVNSFYPTIDKNEIKLLVHLLKPSAIKKLISIDQSISDIPEIKKALIDSELSKSDIVKNKTNSSKSRVI